MPNEKKICTKCGETKFVIEFNWNGYSRAGTRTRRPDCKSCDSNRTRKPHIRTGLDASIHNAKYRAKIGAEAWAARNKAWREKNPNYYVENLERMRENGRNKSAKRRAVIRSLPAEAISSAVVFERSNGTCGICRTPITGLFQIDHIVPIALGGPHLYSNVQAAHAICNQKKGARLLNV